MASITNFLIEVKTPKEAKQKIELAKKLFNYSPETHNIEVGYRGKAYNHSYGSLRFEQHDGVTINSKNQLVYRSMFFNEIDNLWLYINIFEI